jgi:hypothetical protein
MSRPILRTAALAVVAIIPISHASAHCFVGGRFLPATLIVDDPCVADELSLPTASWMRNGDDPSASEFDISAEFSKRITDTFGVSVGSTWTHIRPPGGPSVSGWQNLDTSFKSQFYTNTEHEFVMSAALGVEWGGTGSNSVGADSFSTLTPTFFFGKGFGDLPESFGWARAFAVTGQVGYAVPTKSTIITVDDGGDLSIENNPSVLQYGGTLQFSMPYLKSSVIDAGLPDFINHLIPIVEASFETPVSNNTGTGLGTTGTVNPGVIWVGNYYQVGAEAIIPVNRASGTGTGVIAQLHIYIDDLFPDTIGRPLLADGTANTTGKPIFGN